MTAELHVRRCVSCGHVAWPPRLLCPACGAPGSGAESIPAGPGVVLERTDTFTPSGDAVALVTVRLRAGPDVIARAREAMPGATVRLTGDGPDEPIEAAPET